MPDTDRILEAEQSIQSIASELKRMHDAANLLQGSQAQLDAVLTSTQRLMQVTEKFSGECGVIVAKLAATDLNQRLDDLQTLHSELATAAGSIRETLRSAIGELQDGIQAASSSLSATVKAAGERTHSDFEQIVTLVKEQANGANAVIADIELKLRTLENQLQSAAEGSKRRQIVTMVFAILTFLAALFLLSKALVPSLGG